MAITFATSNQAPVNDTDANFRLWGSGISAAIAAAGLVQTADTGQINWTTVATPNATNQSRGYEIWRFNDALQATRPVFVRIQYGSGPNTSWNPQMWFAIGTATDGAGNITANASFPNSTLPQRTLFTTASAAWYSSTRGLVYVSSDGGGSLTIAAWPSLATSVNQPWCGCFFVAERTRDWDGTLNGEGVLTVTSAANANAVSQTLIIGNAAIYSQGTQWTGVPAMAGGGMPLTPRTGMVGGGVIHAYPVLTGTTPQVHGPSKHVVAVWPGDFPVYSRFPLTVHGEVGTYMSLGTYFLGWDTASAATCGAIRVA